MAEHDELHELIAERLATLQSAIDAISEISSEHTQTLTTLIAMVDLIAKASNQQSVDLQQIKADLAGVLEALKPGARH